MDNLLESKKIRERDRLRAQDVKIKRDREQEGDEFANKEVFVTSAYKIQQEELDKLAAIEEKNQGMYTIWYSYNICTNAADFRAT